MKNYILLLLVFNAVVGCAQTPNITKSSVGKYTYIIRQKPEYNVTIISREESSLPLRLKIGDSSPVTQVEDFGINDNKVLQKAINSVFTKDRFRQLSGESLGIRVYPNEKGGVSGIVFSIGKGFTIEEIARLEERIRETISFKVMFRGPKYEAIQPYSFYCFMEWFVNGKIKL